MGKQRKQWQILFSWSPKSLQRVTAAMKLKDTCSLEEKLYEPRQHIKSRDVALPIKIHLVKAMVFPVVMYGYESWTIKQAEHWWTDVFELWCWRRLLRVPWNARIKPVHLKGNQTWIFIRETDAEAETPILWPPDAKNCLIRKDPVSGKVKAGREGDDGGWDGWMASRTQWTWVWASSGSWWWTGKPGNLQSMGSQRVGHDLATELETEY